jgi:predicted RNA-binding Zn ribbon-like protein
MQTGPPPAPGEERSIALALVNTQHRNRRAFVDEIATCESLGDWLESRGIALSRLPSDAELERVDALREAVRNLMHATVTGQPPAASALRALNDAATTAPRVPGLEWIADCGLVRRYATGGADAFGRAISAIATDAIELLTDERRGALIECSGPSCVRFLLKDHPRRHWCSAGCGERARAARYYRRTRAQPDA